jgi:hypothetical protein
LILFLFCFGCGSFNSLKIFRPFEKKSFDFSKMNFERTLDKSIQLSSEGKKLTVRFDDSTFNLAMKHLSVLSDVTIVWSKDLDNQLVSGVFYEQTIDSILSTLARRYSVSVSRIGSIFYLGQYSRDDVVSVVFRLPPSDSNDFIEGVRVVLSEYGKVNVIGSVVWIADRFELVQKVLNSVEDVRIMLDKSYIAEVYFLRVSEENFANFTADLRFNAVDIFSSSVNLESLFECMLSGDLSLGGVVVDSRPVLYLSEGREAKLELGSTVTVGRSAVNERGVIETVGYEKFSDGLSLTLALCRVSDDRYSVNMDLTISTFEKTSSDAGIPNLRSSILNVPGVLCRDNSVCFVGQIKNTDKTKKFGLFGFDYTGTTDLVTVWLRVREVK